MGGRRGLSFIQLEKEFSCAAALQIIHRCVSSCHVPSSAATVFKEDNQAVTGDSELSNAERIGFEPGGLRSEILLECLHVQLQCQSHFMIFNFNISMSSVVSRSFSLGVCNSPHPLPPMASCRNRLRFMWFDCLTASSSSLGVNVVTPWGQTPGLKNRPVGPSLANHSRLRQQLSCAFICSRLLKEDNVFS